MDKLKRISEHFYKYKFLLLAGLLGAILLVLPFGKSESGAGSDIYADADRYSHELFDVAESETRLENVLKEIKGVGRVKVMLTLETDFETIFAMDNESNTEYAQDAPNNILREVIKEEYVIIKSTSDPETPIIRKIVYPKYKGAVIVCEGGDEASVQLKVLRSVSSLTGLTADRISVQKMK